MQPKSLKYLTDMRDAAAELSTFIHGKTREEFLGDRLLQRAVERQFEIIGEALTQLRKVDAPMAESITDWRAIIGFRNVLIHGYGEVNVSKTWDIAAEELPLLQREIAELLGN